MYKLDFLANFGSLELWSYDKKTKEPQVAALLQRINHILLIPLTFCQVFLTELFLSKGFLKLLTHTHVRVHTHALVYLSQ